MIVHELCSVFYCLVMEDKSPKRGRKGNNILGRLVRKIGMEDKSPKRGRKPAIVALLYWIDIGRMEDKSPKRGRKHTPSYNCASSSEWKISPRRGDGNSWNKRIGSTNTTMNGR